MGHSALTSLYRKVLDEVDKLATEKFYAKRSLACDLDDIIFRLQLLADTNENDEVEWWERAEDRGEALADSVRDDLHAMLLLIKVLVASERDDNTSSPSHSIIDSLEKNIQSLSGTKREFDRMAMRGQVISTKTQLFGDSSLEFEDERGSDVSPVDYSELWALDAFMNPSLGPFESLLYSSDVGQTDTPPSSNLLDMTGGDIVVSQEEDKHERSENGLVNVAEESGIDGIGSGELRETLSVSSRSFTGIDNVPIIIHQQYPRPNATFNITTGMDLDHTRRAYNSRRSMYSSQYQDDLYPPFPRPAPDPPPRGTYFNSSRHPTLVTIHTDGTRYPQPSIKSGSSEHSYRDSALGTSVYSSSTRSSSNRSSIPSNTSIKTTYERHRGAQRQRELEIARPRWLADEQLVERGVEREIELEVERLRRWDDDFELHMASRRAIRERVREIEVLENAGLPRVRRSHSLSFGPNGHPSPPPPIPIPRRSQSSPQLGRG